MMGNTSINPSNRQSDSDKRLLDVYVEVIITSVTRTWMLFIEYPRN